MPKTSKKHFDLFKKESLKYIDLLGLREYDILFKHVTLQDSLAGCDVYWQSRHAILYLGKDWNDTNFDLTDQEIKRTAFHEVLEILLMPIRDYANKRNCTPELVDCEIHRIIQTLLNTFHDKVK